MSLPTLQPLLAVQLPVKMFPIICCRCAENADEGTEGAADDEVVPISALNNGAPAGGKSPVKQVKKDKAKLAESGKKLHACARSVRHRVAKEKEELWNKTSAEFNVQKMVWQSLSMTLGCLPLQFRTVGFFFFFLVRYVCVCACLCWPRLYRRTLQMHPQA